MVTLDGITFLASVGVSIIVAASIIGLINMNGESCLGDQQKNVREMVQNGNLQAVGVKILNHQMTKPLLSNWIVRGQVEKSGGIDERYSMVTVIFLDEGGNPLNSSSTRIDRMMSGEIKDFEVPYHGSGDPMTYKIELSTFT